MKTNSPLDFDCIAENAAASAGELRSILVAYERGTDSPEYAHDRLLEGALEQLEFIEGHPSHDYWHTRVFEAFELVECPMCCGAGSWSSIDMYDVDQDWDCPSCDALGVVSVDRATEIERELLEDIEHQRILAETPF